MEPEVEQRKQRRSAAKRKFSRKYNLFRESVSLENPELLLQNSFIEIQEAYNDVESAHEGYLEALVIQGTGDSQIETEENYITELEKKRNDAHALLIEHSDNKNKLQNSQSTKVKIKALEPPKFDGNVREYPSFKSNFERLMNDNFGKDPFALKQCLTGDALKTVLGVEDDYEEMFKRLDEKFGNKRKIVDFVINDLKSLKKLSDCDGKGFIKMVERVERCWLDLKKMNLTSEMNTANTVSHIEKILPSTQKREWVLLAESLTDSDDLFPSLLKFLLREKRAIEYMDSSIRCVASYESKSTVHNITALHEGAISDGSSELFGDFKRNKKTIMHKFSNA
ncbi:hypothetical protein Pmani_023248 [Petrolisthes manimaculis]|uniref:Uncharacterized protein n=1 Tax=Petrolisthes manimaculis TaxID=1843537 RepID=A0AAE1PAF4_9EUCA|nr:hypothetical protein Pmani_023248 [Petrolisthes manimaculis]